MLRTALGGVEIPLPAAAPTVITTRGRGKAEIKIQACLFQLELGADTADWQIFFFLNLWQHLGYTIL